MLGVAEAVLLLRQQLMVLEFGARVFALLLVANEGARGCIEDIPFVFVVIFHTFHQLRGPPWFQFSLAILRVLCRSPFIICCGTVVQIWLAMVKRANDSSTHDPRPNARDSVELTV